VRADQRVPVAHIVQAWLDTGISAEIVAHALGHAGVSVTPLICGNQAQKRVRSALREAEISPFPESFRADEVVSR